MTLDGGRRRSAPPALTAVRFERTAAKKGEATLARNLLLATLVLWADTVAAEPFGCVSSTGQVRMLVRSPAVCLATETPMSWDPDQPTSGRRRRRFMMKMHNPPHPGEVLKDLCLKPKGLSVTEVARALGVSRKTLSAILNGRAGISPEMAVRLSIAFDTTAESWLNQQVQYDLSQAAEAEEAASEIARGVGASEAA